MSPPRSRSYSSGAFGTSAPVPGYTTSPAAKQQQCTITWDSVCQAYNINVPFQPNFVEFIKAKVPGSDRAWVSSTKTWVVKENWMEVIRLLASELWPGQVTVVSKQQVEDAERSAREQQRIAVLAVLPERERAMFEFFEVCPLECLSAAYKRAATLLHPDKQNGDGDTMARLNAAWSKLEKELGTGK